MRDLLQLHSANEWGAVYHPIRRQSGVLIQQRNLSCTCSFSIHTNNRVPLAQGILRAVAS